MRQIVPQQDPSVAFVTQAFTDFEAFRLPVTSTQFQDRCSRKRVD